MLVNRKEKDILWQNVECSCAFKNTENFLEHWTTFTYNTDSETMETGIAVCTTHHKKFKLHAFFIKYCLKYSCFQDTIVPSSNFTLFLIYFMFV